MEPKTPGSSVVTALHSGLKGRVIKPSDADYPEVKSVFYGGSERRPAAVARVVDSEDVAHVISVARDSGIELAIRSGGHTSSAA
jgi:hypothetical protein